MIAPKPRWSRFLPWSLATAGLAVASITGWIALNLHWMHQREVMLRRAGISFVGNLPEQRDLPILWKLFGARSIGAVNRDSATYTEADLRRYEAHFPEARVTREEQMGELPSHLTEAGVRSGKESNQ